SARIPILQATRHDTCSLEWLDPGSTMGPAHRERLTEEGYVMSRMSVSVCGALAVGAALAATSFSFAQPPDRQERREERREVRQARRAKDILGSRINIQGNMAVGTV